MKIIFEGLDRVGKSSLTEKIKLDFKRGFITTHSSFTKGTDKYWPNMAKEEYSNLFELFNSNINVICDRCHGGETVYGEIYRGYSGDYVYELESKYNLDKIDDLYLIVLIDNANNVIRRDDGESFTTKISKKNIEIEKFKIFYNRSIIKNKVLININNKSISKVHKIIKKELNWI